MSYWLANNADPQQGYDSEPSQQGQYVGAGASMQDSNTVQQSGDRVNMLAGITTESPTQTIPLLSADFGGSVPWDVGGYSFNDKPGLVYAPDNPNGKPYDFGRTHGGYPLPPMPDQEYAHLTSDYVGNTVVDESNDHGFLLPAGFHLVPEKLVQVGDRPASHPSDVQPVRPWDRVTGAWPWSGHKTAMARPNASGPLVFSAPLDNAPPAPTGTRNADFMLTNYDPMPLTFRVTPSPWDTQDDGYYVDSGN